MRNKKNKKKIIIIIAIAALVLAGVGLATAMVLKKDKTKTDKPKEKPKEVIPEKKLNIINEESTSRPYAVMINNIGVARPLQSGLQDAYIIYEIIVEGGITRYMALFMDQNTERIGSVRSARHYYLDYVLENDAIYVHHGQSPQAQADFSNLGIDRIVADSGKTGWRDTSLKVSSEHTLFTNIEKLNSGLGNKRTTRNKELLLNYSVDEVDLSKMENAKVANNIAIKYSKSFESEYSYDADSKLYYRSVNNKAHTDYVTKEQYTFKNIITYQVKNYTLVDPENKGRQGLENIGSGSGYYITNGYAIPITWEKSSRSAQTLYKYENGNEIDVNDGNTFIQIQPKGESLSIS